MTDSLGDMTDTVDNPEKIIPLFPRVFVAPDARLRDAPDLMSS
jgi:hypothetical protein